MSKDDKKVENNDEKNENVDKVESKKEEDNLRKKKEEELFTVLAESFYDYLINNINKYKTSNFYEIFSEFLQEIDDNGKNVFIELEKRLGREITFDDIKYLYLKTGHTLFEDAIKEIFKKYGNNRFIKEITSQTLKKIEIFLKDKGFLDEAEKVFNLENKVETFKIDEKLYSIDDFYKIVRGELQQIIKELPEDIKLELMNLKITNEQIIASLKNKNFITDEEYKYIKGEIKEITDDLKNKISLDKINSLQSSLFNANIISVVDSIDENFRKLNLDLRKVVEGLPLSRILDKSNLIISIEDISDELWSEMSENIRVKLKKCIGTINEQDCVEKIIKANLNDPIIKKILVKNLKKKLNSNDRILGSIIEKALESDNVSAITLTDEEKEYLFSVLFDDYKKNFLDKFIKSFKGYSDLKPIIDDIFDLTKDKITLPNGKQIDIERDINLTIDPAGDNKVIETFDKIFDLVPQINLVLKGKNIIYLRDILPNKFVIINGKTICKDSLSKIKFKDGNEITGSVVIANHKEYPEMKCSKKVVEIYNKAGGDLSDTEPVKVVCEEEIQNIEMLDPKIELKGNDEVSSFIFKLRNIENTENFNDKVEEKVSYEVEDQVHLDSNLGLKEFKKEWNKLEGDGNVDFEVGNVITVKGNVLKIPGLKKNWYNLEIVEIDEKRGIWRVRPYGGLLDIEGGDKVYDLPLSVKELRDLKYLYDDAFFKLKKIGGVDEFGDYIKNIVPILDSGVYERTLNKWKRKVSIKGGKLVDEKGQEIKYIGKVKDASYNPNEKIEKGTSITEFFDVFKIEIEGNYVRLTYPYNSRFNKKIDYNSFLLILLDNQLEPWTEEEFVTNEKQYTSVAKESAKKGLDKRFYYSFGNLVFSFKEIINVGKQYFKDEDDFRAAEMLAGISSHIPEWIPILGDISVEANAEKEARIWQRITAAKDRLARADKGGNHAKVAAEIIKNEIFLPVLAGKELNYRKKLKAAGYLLYALEKGPGEYFRALANYAGKGVWVKALFGEAHYQKWLLQNQEIRRQLSSNPTDENLRNKLIFSEIYYLKDIPEAADLYSSNFPAVVEGNKINVYAGSKVQEVYEGEVNKGNYYTIYDAWKSYVLNNRPPNTLGALKAITERVEEEGHYVDYYKIHLLMNFTGYIYAEYNSTLKESYQKICRTYGIPIGLYASEYDGLEKTLRIIDYIVKSKGIKPGGKSSLTEYLYGIKDPRKIHPLDPKFREKSTRAKIVKKMEDFWNEYGEEIVRVLDYRDPLLLKENENILPEDKEILKDYFGNKVNDKIDEDFAVDRNLFKTAYSPYYQHGVLNLSKKGFSEVAGVSGGEFVSGAIGKNVWIALEKKLNKIADKVEDNPQMFNFIFSKFKLWLNEPYKDHKNDIALLAAILSKNDIQLDTVLIDFMKEKYGNFINGSIPNEMVNGLKAFKRVFKNANIDDIIRFLVKKDENSNGYYTVEEVAIALSRYELLFSPDQIKSIKKKLNINKNIWEKALLDSSDLEMDSAIYNLLEDLGIDKEKNVEKYTLLFNLIKRVLKKEVSISYLNNLKFISSENKEKIKKFIIDYEKLLQLKAK